MADLPPSLTHLLALHLASNSKLEDLRTLVSLHPTVFPSDVVLEILLRYLPETTPVELYTPLLRDVVHGRVLTPPVDAKAVDTSFIKDINEVSAKRTLEGMGFPQGVLKGEVILEFLKLRAYAIDKETGQVELLKSLVEGFMEDEGGVYAWYMGVVESWGRLVYYASTLGLEEFEGLHVRDGVKLVLDTMVGPEDGDVREGFGTLEGYIRYKRELKGWGYVYEWLGHQGFGTIWRVVRDWDGPEDEGEREGYYKAVMVACYACGRTDEEAVQQMQDVVYRTAKRVNVELTKVHGKEVEEVVERLGGRGWEEWDSSNGELIKPAGRELRLLEQLIVSVRMFAVFPLGLTVREVMRMRFAGSREDQLGLLKRALGVNERQRSDAAYTEVRSAAEFLREESRVLGKLTAEDVEGEVLRDMLTAGKFMAVTTTYVAPKGQRGKKTKPLLPPEVVEKAVIHAVIDFYDKSTNGNRTRGGMKNASNALAILYPNHSNSLPLRRLSKLLSATHSLSEYSLTLTPGTPLKPVQVRLYPDPPDLISRVLQSNPKAYLQLDSLVKIASDLVYGVAKTHDHDHENDGEPTPAETAALKSRITGMCVEAALAEDDFETAFSFVVNKLVPTHQKLRSSQKGSGAPGYPDTAWQAALQAGRYRSPAMLAESMEGVATSQGIEQVQKRMEVLSQALVICPAEAMMDVLRTWKNCEEELEGLLELEVQEERKHAGKLGDWVGGAFKATLPGTTIPGESLLKAPMSLLGVASTAGRVAKSLGSSAFPLSSSRQSEEGSQRGSGEYERGEDGERVRKRDVLSGMVTSGLASGLGWMLGAKAEDMNAGQR